MTTLVFESKRASYVLKRFLRSLLRGFIQTFPDWVDNEMNSNNNKHSLRSNTKGYGGKTH